GIALDSLHPRFPIAGIAASRSFIYLPAGMTVLQSDPASAVTFGGDGATEFDEGIFLDSRLAGIRSLDLIAEADYIRYQRPKPDRADGTPPALGVEEATIIAVPDAVRTGGKAQTTKRSLPAPTVASPPAIAAPPLFWNCDSPPVFAAVASPPVAT